MTTTTGATTSSAGVRGRRRPARHRPGRRARQHPRPPRRRASAPRSSTTGPTSGCWSSTSSPGTALDERRLRRARRARAGRRRRAAGCTRGRGSSATSTCSPRQARLPRDRARARLPRCPTAYDDHAAAWERRTPGARRPRRGRPCRATTTCWPRNFIDDGERVWLIDYEYSGNNDACFELGNTATECELRPTSRSRRWCDGVLRRPDARGPAPGCGCRRCAASTAGRSGASSRPPPARIDFDFHGWGMERFEKAAAHVPRRRLRRGCSSEVAVTTDADLPARARVVVIGGGVIGCSVAYHLTKLGLDRRAAARAGHAVRAARPGTRPGWSARCARSESGTRLVQYSAELYASLEAETGLATGYRNVGGVIVARTEDRMVQLRRTAANAAAYDLDCELLTPERAQELWPVDAGRRPARRDLAARRRQGQPDRPDPGAGQGRAAGRRAGRRAGAGDRVRRRRTARRAPGDRRARRTTATSRPRWSSTAPASGPRRSATRSASPCRCTRPSTSTSSPSRSRASTPTCRSCATPTAGPTSRRRSAASWSAASSPRPSRGGRRTTSRTRSSSSCSRRTGSTSRC